MKLLEEYPISDTDAMLEHEREVLSKLHYARDCIQFQIDMCVSRISAIKFAQCEFEKKKNAP